MIVGRCELRQAGISESEVNRIVILAIRYPTVCDYGNKMKSNEKGYIYLSAVFDLQKLYEYTKNRAVTQNVAKKMIGINKTVEKAYKRMLNGVC